MTTSRVHTRWSSSAICSLGRSAFGARLFTVAGSLGARERRVTHGAATAAPSVRANGLRPGASAPSTGPTGPSTRSARCPALDLQDPAANGADDVPSRADDKSQLAAGRHPSKRSQFCATAGSAGVGRDSRSSWLKHPVHRENGSAPATRNVRTAEALAPPAGSSDLYYWTPRVRWPAASSTLLRSSNVVKQPGSPRPDHRRRGA